MGLSWDWEPLCGLRWEPLKPRVKELCKEHNVEIVGLFDGNHTSVSLIDALVDRLPKINRELRIDLLAFRDCCPLELIENFDGNKYSYNGSF